MTDRDVQCQQRDARFDESPLGSGMCPLLLDVAIFPVRYAIDEAPRQAGEPAPHPLTSPWQGPDYPGLQTCSYTLRQLRDGWVYVWVEEEGEQRIDEHRVEGATFGGQPHLTYSTQARLALAYSPVQWTERIQAYMLADAQVRQRVMRSVDLLAALTGTAQPGGAFPAHIGPITQLAEHVADITPNGAVDGFTTTTVSTSEREGDMGEEDDTLYEVLSVRPEITQDSVLAQVERHDEALFVALDDDLGIVNDLIMALLGREAELEAFLDEHGHKLETAQVTQALCGPDDSDLPEAVRDDPERYRQAQRLLQQRLEAQEAQEFSTAMNRGSPFGRAGSSLQRQHEECIAAIDSNLAAMGIEPPSRDARDAWRSKRRWRDDVDYAGVVNFINTEQPRLERLQAHVQASLEDVIVWLGRLPTDGESLCFDLCDEAQSQTLLEFAALVSEALGATAQGRQWLTGTFRERDSLIGTGPFNFSPTLAAAFDGIALQWLEGGADGAGGLGVMPSDVAGFAGHVDTVLRLEHVQESALFLALAQPVQDTFATLQKVAAGAGRQAWEALAYQALPAAGAGAQVAAQQIARGASIAMLAAFVHPDNQGTFLQRNDGALAQQRHWRAGMLRLSVQIKAQQLLLRAPMSSGRRAEVFRTLSSLENDYQALALQEPKRFTAGPAQGAAAPLATLGFEELREQHRLRMQHGAGSAVAARQRMAQWMESRGIGGLPLLIAALNLVNVADSVRNAQRDGMNQADLEKLASQASYATAAVMALWVMPYWQRHANQTASLRGTTRSITGVGVARWQAAGQASAARIAAKLSSRVAGMAVFAAIGAGVESWQIWQQTSRTTSSEEKNALWAKLGATVSMSVIGSAQLGGALLGRWFAFGWILAPWASWALLALSVGYLIASMLAEHYRREGVRLWLYQSTWGKANKWSDSDADRAAELRALNEALLAPSLKLTPVVRTEFDVSRTSSQFSPGRRVETLQGYWVQLALPAVLGGEKVSVSQSAMGGFWAPSDSFTERPATEINRELPEAATYLEGDPLRVWQAWLSADQLPDGQPFLFKVTYDEAVYGDISGGLSFTFYKAEPRRGRHEVEVDDRYRGLCSSATVALTVPTS
ncbi:T6SS effector BTH_I2691 family protein [Billgrantia sp. LNSP4103-1]|uniref:T6SS effector BTH_I2691 family protein n=1 Tax=Billgrantia sp. LNSP4103-1 TaxID=3410266 RepID=UPI00403F128C